MDNKDKLMYIGHIRLIIEGDVIDGNGSLKDYNKPEKMVYTTMKDDEIRSIVLENKNYHKLVIRQLEQFIEAYKEKYGY